MKLSLKNKFYGSHLEAELLDDEQLAAIKIKDDKGNFLTGHLEKKDVKTLISFLKAMKRNLPKKKDGHEKAK